MHSDTSMEPDNTQLAVSRADKFLFQHLDIGCVVHTEIVQTIDNIIFFPASSAKEDAQIDPVSQLSLGEKFLGWNGGRVIPSCVPE